MHATDRLESIISPSGEPAYCGVRLTSCKELMKVIGLNENPLPQPGTSEPLFQHGSKRIFSVNGDPCASIGMGIRKRRNGPWEATNMAISKLSKMRQVNVSLIRPTFPFTLQATSSHESILLSTDSRKQGQHSQVSVSSQTSGQPFKFTFYIIPQKILKQVSSINLTLTNLDTGKTQNLYHWEMKVACHQYESRQATIAKHNMNTEETSVPLDL